MFQPSLFSSKNSSEPDCSVSSSQGKRKLLDRRGDQPSSRQSLSPSKESSCRAGKVFAQTANGINHSQIIADTQTPILDRFAPDTVIPLTELFAVYQAVDQRLALLLERSTTATEVVCALAAEPYACYNNAVRGIGEADLLKKITADLRSLAPDAALQQLAQLPPFFQEKVWAQLSDLEQRQFVQASRCIGGGAR